MEKRKIPAVRFKGFEDDWEQRKLGDIIEFLDTLRKPLKETDREPGPYPYYGASGIVDYVADYIFDEELILLSEDGANITDRNYPVCFLATGKYWVNNHAHVLKARNKMDNNFICMSMERKDYSNYNTGMAMPKLNKDTCCQIPVDCPTFDEQRKIGAYFRKLDNLITLHQRKLEKLQLVKKSMLEKMFPKNGSKIPEIRFEGFADNWEQRKLGELVEIGDIDHRMPETVADGIPYLMTGDFVGTNELNFDGTKMISEEDYCQLSQKIKPEKGDILFARYASVGAARYVDFTRKFLISYSCAIIKKSKKINSKYLYHFITSDNAQQQIKLEINTGSQANIGIDSMKNHIVVSMPPLEEQTKIADALSNLDHLITLHQSKLKSLEFIYKFFLGNSVS